MVTCKLLGRTGNQCFIIAAVIGYAKKHGLEYHIPAHTQNDEKWKPMFTHLENPNYNPGLPKIKIEERGFAYNHLPAPPSKDCNIELSGYFQSHKYFDHCIEDVRKAFLLPYFQRKNISAIHIRLGDYKNLQEFHPVVTSEYLKKAIRVLYENDNPEFVVFSDEIEGAKQMIQDCFPNLIKLPPFLGLYDPETRISFLFADCIDEISDLISASCCDHIIGSNSSFSLWMYYLNQNPGKIGFFPKRWFGPKLPHNTKDLYPENAIIL